MDRWVSRNVRWVAPELENDPGGEFQPIQAALWSSGNTFLDV